MSFFIPLSFYATQMINTYLNSRISANDDKVDGLSANDEGNCFSIVELLLYNIDL